MDATPNDSPKVDAALAPGSMLLNAKQVAALLQISVRTVYRLKDSGSMPQPQKLGTLLARWNREEIENWVRTGMPRCRDFVPTPKHRKVASKSEGGAERC